eukprot:TRINITY_DN12444_c0_g1_i2.p1 TRINITY_DN12444_c0_g1~~TRINITY_DN12444_c0_g1_i2.p1  ORF type:complete len:320 (+),score=38.13 TRINITY_DN12444_c0_g1_i2:93-1052(+)
MDHREPHPPLPSVGMATALEEHQSNAAMIAPDLVLGDGTALSGDVDMHLHQPLNAVELAMLDADLGQSSGPLSHLVQSPSLSDDEWIALHFRLPGPDEFASGNHPHEDLPFFRTTPVSVDNDDVDRNSTVRDSNTSPLPVFPEAKMRYPSPDHINSPSFALHCKAATLKQPRKRRTACKQTSAKRTLDRRQTSALKAKQAALPSLENEPDSCDDDLSPADHIGHIAAQACMLLGDDAPSYGFFAKLIAAYTPDVAARLSGNRPQLTVHAVGERSVHCSKLILSNVTSCSFSAACEALICWLRGCIASCSSMIFKTSHCV